MAPPMSLPALEADAPPFDLAALTGRGQGRVSLRGLRGRWVVLFFYPADFSFVCPTEVRGFAAAASTRPSASCERCRPDGSARRTGDPASPPSRSPATVSRHSRKACDDGNEPPDAPGVTAMPQPAPCPRCRAARLAVVYYDAEGHPIGGTVHCPECGARQAARLVAQSGSTQSRAELLRRQAS